MITHAHNPDENKLEFRGIRDKVTIWVAGDCRPINMVEDSGLIEVIQIASEEILTIYR